VRAYDDVRSKLDVAEWNVKRATDRVLARSDQGGAITDDTLVELGRLFINVLVLRHLLEQS
jgi:hypothetical protein